QPHILHVHAAKAGMLGRLASRTVRPRPAVVYTPHGGAFHEVFGGLRNRVYAGLERAVAPLADVVINVSHYSTRVFAEKTGLANDRLRTIHNGVALPAQPAPAVSARLRHDLNLPPDGLAVAVIAQPNPN